MSNKNFINKIDLKNKLVFIRVDFNVPIDSEGNILDATRIEKALPTIKYVLKQNGRVILCSHLGRPKGKIDLKLSLKNCASFVSHRLNLPVCFIESLKVEDIQTTINNNSACSVFMLENIRFLPEEESLSRSSWAQSMSQLIDVYINDAFGASHRNHMSMYDLPLNISQKSVGLLVEEECHALNKCVTNVKRPFAAVIGGAKVSTKLKLIERLIESVDYLLIGGGMVNTFEKANGATLQSPLIEESVLSDVRRWFAKAEENKCKILLPVDYLISTDLNTPKQTRFDISPVKLSSNEVIVDIGPKTVQKYSEILQQMETVFWNGPMGRFEVKGFDQGTMKIANILANIPGYTVVGGGDSLAAINSWGLQEGFSHICTGGGASLSYIESHGKLPAIDILSEDLIRS